MASESPPILFDTHAHLEDERFDADRDELLAELPKKGVAYALTVGSDIETSRAAARLAREHSYIWGAAGVHPHNAAEVQQGYLDELEQLLLGMRKMAAVGEIGLDYHYGERGSSRQKAVFESQLELAARLSLPVVIHNREADQDTVAILREHAKGLPGGVFHCFSGPPSLLEEAIGLGFHVAYGGACTFRKSQAIADAISLTPLDRLLIETDCPYLAPEPFRGRRNDPSLVGYVAERVAKIKGVEAPDLARAAMGNALALFRIAG